MNESILQGEYIVDFAVEPIRPDMSPRRCIDKLCVDPHLVCGALHTALQNVADPKVLSDFAYIY